jgi:3-phosphoshikimate 1-carboxyvinyltransferase
MMTIKKINKIKGTFSLPSDKSISHRALMLSSIAGGKTSIDNFLHCDDTAATLNCLLKLGIAVNTSGGSSLIIEGKGLRFKITKPEVRLNAGESGTTMRILSGLLCGQSFNTHFQASEGLSRRPMQRIITPLTRMGAVISGTEASGNVYPPLYIRGHQPLLRPIDYVMPVASAQVKSAILFASLYAQGMTTIKEPSPSRDHTERMFTLFGMNISAHKSLISFECGQRPVSPEKIFIPADFSSAAFFIVLGLITEDSQFTLKNININPTRSALLQVLKRMGADIRIINENKAYEPYADIVVKSSALRATEITSEEVPAMIDEVQILSVAAAFAKGNTAISGVEELRVKETDRIEATIKNLSAAGVTIYTEKETLTGKEKLIIQGCSKFRKAAFSSFNDHRTAMSAIIQGAASGKECAIDNCECINKSFPQFLQMIDSL